MLTDELPQLLQNLLVGVERSIGRISLNELQTYSVGDQQQQQQQQFVSAVDDTTNNNCNFTSNNGVARVNITNSPKCALKRSELITKNKLLSNKYMLRRLTNRQDSMNSTSSGNSCNSNSSISSDELLYSHNSNKNNNNNNSNSNNNDATLRNNNEANKSNSISPALPLFCLGNSFPHIDSDEENPDDKRNSLECDQIENEIIPPSSITELPEKLLASGIYLPGTRDLHGHPLVTVDAEVVIAAGLNCYEVATVLLYYSTIPER
ncbi:putative uncharacterized protein DDB_G0274535 [Teleopsis dalmanni]|uniref:putative uncharacterized protein DDB_G0274535 n=1 Tax=Teleopsis dalmanni TaxID=139649 RepID=UPI0018CF8C08|nr:putative uncharacterized protein DDB_G0274535 [Teleopsis dalmanni]